MDECNWLCFRLLGHALVSSVSRINFCLGSSAQWCCYCQAGSSANNLALLNYEYLAIYLCAYDLECNQPLSPPTSHSIQPHGMMEESSADRNQLGNQRLGHLRTQRHRAQQRRGSHRDLLPKGSVKHDAMSNSLLKEGMLPYHRTAAITACIIIWLFPLPELTGLLP